MITWNETPDSFESSESPRACTRHYRLAGIFEHTTAKGYAIQSLASIYDGLLLLDVKIDPDGFNIWKVAAVYGVPTIDGQGGVGRSNLGLLDWGWDTTGGTKKITQAKEHIYSYGRAGNNAGDPFKGAIGVHNGEVEGCEIVWPVFKWHEKWGLYRSYATLGYSIVCEGMTGRVNAATFRGRVRGTVRFDGAQAGGSTKDPNTVEITYQFAGSPNISGETVGAVTGVAAEGWHYVWIEYQAEQDSGTKKLVKQPLMASVERVYDYGDFSLLGIGTGLF